MKQTTWNVFPIILFAISGYAGDAVIIPIRLNAEQLLKQDIPVGQDAYLNIEYTIKPDGDVLFREEAEKLWWIGETPLLMLGSSGIALPQELSQRAGLYLNISLDSDTLLLKNHLIHPIKQSVSVLATPSVLAQALSTSVSMDVTYLAEVANYLTGNLNSISITASSYSVDGYGEVINNAGEWTGEAIAGGGSSVWTQNGHYVSMPDSQDRVSIGLEYASWAKLQIRSQAGVPGIRIDNVSDNASIVVTSGNQGLLSDGPLTGAYLMNAENGLVVDEISDDGIIIKKVGAPSRTFSENTQKDGIEILNVEGNGIRIGSTDACGIHIGTTGNPTQTNSIPIGNHGIGIVGAESNGVSIGYAGNSGVYLGLSGGTGFYANQSGYHGIHLNSCSVDGVHVGTSGEDGIEIEDAGAHGVNVIAATKDGVHIVNADESALCVENAGDNGLLINDAGKHGILVKDANWGGIKVDASGSTGLSVQNAGSYGIYLAGSTDQAIQIQNSGSDGIHITAVSDDGIHIASAVNAGVRVTNASTGFRAYNCTEGILVSSCTTAANFSGTGAGLSQPALKCESTHNNGIAAYIKNQSTDATLVLANHNTTGHIIKAFSGADGSNLVYRVNSAGHVYADGSFHSGGADLAETFEVVQTKQDYEPGDVMVISTEKEMSLEKTTKAYSPLVAGVYATKPGVVLGPDLENGTRIPLGVVGIIPTKVNLTGGPIEPGDLLVTSSIPGEAMKADLNKLRPGCLIGKALQYYDGNQNETKINVLVNVK
jgi:hypothetical protein